MNCKGVTVYRDGSRDNQVLSTGATEKAAAERGGASEKRQIGELHGTIAEKDSEIERLRKALFDSEAENLQRRIKRARPDRLRGTTIRKETPLGTHALRGDRKSTRLNSSHAGLSRMPSSA